MDASLKLKAEQFAGDLAHEAKTLEDFNELLRSLAKSALERMLDTEMDVHLGRHAAAAPPAVGASEVSGQAVAANRRNGHSKKTVRGDRGELTLELPRDRDGTFEPLLIPKYQRRLPGFDEKIFALYAKGLTTRDIQEVVKELYGVEVSPWQQRRLDPIWPIVYLDGLVVHVRGDSCRVSPHTMYVAMGVNLQGTKELLGLWLSETEGAKFWLACLTDLKSRGLNDIFVACVDGLTGFTDAIRAAYPHTQVQLCIVHLVRAALRYVSTTDSKPVAADLKKIYQAATVPEAEQSLNQFAEVWGQKY